MMRIPAATAALAEILVLLAGCHSPRTVHNAASPTSVSSVAAPNEGGYAGLGALGLRPHWSRNIGLLDGDRIVAGWMLSDQVILLTQQNLCYALDPARGTVRLLAQVFPSTVTKVLPPTIEGQRLYFAAGQKVTALNILTGAREVELSTALSSSASPVAAQDYIYTGDSDGVLSAYGAERQVIHWNSKIGPEVTGLAMWKGQLIIARSEARSRAVDPRKGRGQIQSLHPGLWAENWLRYTEGSLTAPIVVSEDGVYVASRDGSLYKFNAERGHEEWRLRTGSSLEDSPLLAGTRVVQVVPGKGTWCVLAKNRDPLWTDPSKLSFLAGVEDRMFFYDGQAIVAKNANTGKRLGTAAVPFAGAIAVPSPTGPRLFLIDPAGRVDCLSDINQPYLVIGK